jgi:hypothetical protein
MKRISYVGGSFLTSDAVADALFDFIAALGPGPRGESVDIPAVTPQGGRISVRMIVGPASHLLSVPEETVLPEPDDSGEALITLRKRARERTLFSHNASHRPEPSSAFDMHDLDGY